MHKLLAILLTASLLIVTLAIRAQDVPPKPNPPTRVNDFAHVMTADQIDALERKLVAYNDSTTSDIVVVTVPDIGNSTVEDYALQILRTWGVGDKKNNNGIVILADIKDHQVSIQVGYGLEGAIPDVTAKSIIDNEIVPNFKGGGTDNYYRGFDQAADALIKAAAGEYKAPEGYAQGRHGRRTSGNGIGLFAVRHHGWPRLRRWWWRLGWRRRGRLRWRRWLWWRQRRRRRRQRQLVTYFFSAASALLI
jgi:uncharacterized protein